MTALDRTGCRLDFSDDFDGDRVDEGLWIPAYLPQWSSRAATRPRYALADSILTLRIDEDQEPWSTEFDGDTRVSNLQTAVRSGRVHPRGRFARRAAEEGRHRLGARLEPARFATRRAVG